MKYKILMIILICMLVGCSHIDKALEWFKANSNEILLQEEQTNPNPTPVPTIVPTPIPTVIPTPAPTKTPLIVPEVNKHYFVDGPGGNLWKPVSDTTGNLVLVFSSKWKKEFADGCVIEKTDGKLEKLYCGGPFKCFGNPDSGGERLHMRSNIKCKSAKEVKAVCKEGSREIVFTVKDKSKLLSVCSRHD